MTAKRPIKPADDRRNTHLTAHLTAQPGGLLLRYLDGELRGARRSRVAAHLARCPDCASEARVFRALFAGLADLPASPAPLPPFLAGQILAAAAAERAVRAAHRPRWLEIAGAAYTGSAVALLVAGVAVFASPWREPLVDGARMALSELLSGSVGAFVGAFDRIVALLSFGIRAREVASAALTPLAPLGRSLEVVAAQPELRAGFAVALVLSTALWWMIDHRTVAGQGRMQDVPAFF